MILPCRRKLFKSQIGTNPSSEIDKTKNFCFIQSLWILVANQASLVRVLNSKTDLGKTLKSFCLWNFVLHR